jgi:hypothetical protein
VQSRDEMYALIHGFAPTTRLMSNNIPQRDAALQPRRPGAAFTRLGTFRMQATNLYVYNNGHKFITPLRRDH